jgi:CCR4-NOT transcriptional complex subunit CAF120
MLQTYQPPLMEVAQDTLPELQPIFTYLNSHSNKLYQEGYLFKLNDYDPSKDSKCVLGCTSLILTIEVDGKPCSDRNWKEHFAQLVGTILSLWDAAALDASSQDGEVIPTFINLTDASTKV